MDLLQFATSCKYNTYQQQQQLYYQKIYTMFWKKNIYIIKTEYGNNTQKN